MEELLQLLCGLLGSVGFALVFNIKMTRLIPASLGGLFCWAIYLVMIYFDAGIFFASFVSAAFCALYSEILARIIKAPTTIFMVTSVIPLIPGSTLFYTMQYAVLSDWATCKSFGLKTVLYIAGITLGLSIVSAVFKIFTEKKS